TRRDSSDGKTVPFLKIIKGGVPGQLIELSGERTVFGRHPSSQVVLDNSAISRHHAQILETHGTYFLEDLRSRNGTQLNDDSVRGRIELHDSDEIKLCDYVFEFLMAPPAHLGDDKTRGLNRPTGSWSGARRQSGGTGDNPPQVTLPKPTDDDPQQGSSI